MSVRIVARRRIGVRGEYWVVGLVQRRGGPFVDECEHRFESRSEALEYAAPRYKNCDAGSLTAEIIEKAGGLELTP